MLPAPLVRVQVRGDRLIPRWIDPEQPALVEAAEALLALYREGVREGLARGELDRAVDGLLADRGAPKVLKGLARILSDRSTFEVQSPIPPAELRQQVFARARERGPLALEPGPLGRPVAADVLAEVGAAYGLDARAAAEALYADLRENERLVAVDVPHPRWLLDRYNVALVQALLLRALALEVEVVAPSAARMRQLMGQVKFHRLLHRARRQGDRLTLVLDGPASLFHQSTRYGLALANFLPALLLQPGPWTVQATVLWTRRRLRKRLALSDRDGLVSHYADRGGYQTREQRWFAERFDALGSGWTRTEGKLPIPLGERAVLFPDFSFRREGRVAHLEILGFWRHDDLRQRLDRIARYGPGNVVVAVSRKLRGGKEALQDPPDWVIGFGEVVPARKVLAAIEGVARVEGGR